LHVRNIESRSEKCQKLEPHFKKPAKCTNFEFSILGLGSFDEVSVSKLYPGLGLEGYGLDYVTAPLSRELGVIYMF